ncbi:stage V sporulation protein AA [Terrilactibacillus laevilacticus]|uniref:Stage V sporulation protein AA n=1 Tax=Terrilactibacillus laevilacticus TaxID=1380157 RepID=A0ABW5PS02_9BACI|nr:stage V sporulation protein AA [Terrilactibacillus laevilacticus]
MGVISLYVRLRPKFQARCHDIVQVQHIAQIIGPSHVVTKIKKKNIHKITPEDSTYLVIDVMEIIDAIYSDYPEADIQIVGPNQTIIEVQSHHKHRRHPLLFMFVWVLLFIGSGLAIINFHEDVTMGSVHEKIYYLITGEKNAQPLLLQIPYSIGLGLGMILFFNHVFKKKFNEEPSPLEIEMFNYQQDLDQFVILNESKKKEKEKYD